MTYFGQGAPDWWIELHPEAAPKPPPPPRPPRCECGRDYLTVPLDGDQAPCPTQVDALVR